MNSLISLSVTEMREGLLKREFSASELLDAHLKRIADTNKEFNSFILVSEEEARAGANKADEILKKDPKAAPLLSGIPIGIKDMIVTKGIATTCASKILRGFVPPYDSTAVANLKRHGAVIVGKTNMDEFAMGSSNEHSAYGSVKNPWDKARVPGGSSGGSAVCVSLGQAPLALGTDTGGSIRQPAGLCGIAGLKPTYGRVSRYGAVAYASSLDQIGPMARNTEDLAIMMQVIAGQDDNDSTSMDIQVSDYLADIRAKKEKGLKGLRVGVPKEYFIPGMDKEVEDSVRSALKVFEKLGAELVDISLPHTEYALAVYYIITPAEACSNLARYDGVRYGLRTATSATLSDMYEKTRAEGFGAEVKRRILIGSYVLSAGYYEAFYRKAQQVRTLIINDFKAAFHNHCDVIATPVSPSTAFKLGEKIDSPLSMYLADIFTVPTNLAGLPGLALPCALSKNKLPIGIQLLAAPFSESLLLSTAYELERELKFDTKNMTREH